MSNSGSHQGQSSGLPTINTSSYPVPYQMSNGGVSQQGQSGSGLPTINTNSYPAPYPMSPQPPPTQSTTTSYPPPYPVPPPPSAGTNLKRARSNSSPEPDPSKGGPSSAPLSIHKRRAQLKPDATAPATLALPNPSSSRRPLLLNSPFPSPLPPATPKNPKRFDILTRLLSHVDILMEITSYLPPQTLLNLYSISAPFHYLMDSHFTSFMVASTKVWAPEAENIFPWWCFRQLCIEDPGLRQGKTLVETRSLSWTDKHGTPHTTIWKALEATVSEKKAGAGEIEKGERRVSDEHKKALGGGEKGVYVKAVPSFRWLKMVVWREMVSREIVGYMAVHGHRLPRDDTVEAIKKMWFLMDMPVNAPRIALIHNTAYFTPKSLFMLQTLFLKLDMLYTSPIHAFGGEYRLREMLLAERSPLTLWDYLRGADGNTRLDIMRLWVKHGYRRLRVLGPLTEKGQKEWDEKCKMPVLGVPAKLVGRWGYECWGLSRNKMLRPDELVLREGVRRRLDMQRMWIRMIASGHLTPELGPRTDAVADRTVLSLIRRRRNREREERIKKEGEGGEDEEDVVMKDADGGGLASSLDAEIGSIQSSVMQMGV